MCIWPSWLGQPTKATSSDCTRDVTFPYPVSEKTKTIEIRGKLIPAAQQSTSIQDSSQPTSDFDGNLTTSPSMESTTTKEICSQPTSRGLFVFMGMDLFFGGFTCLLLLFASKLAKQNYKRLKRTYDASAKPFFPQEAAGTESLLESIVEKQSAALSQTQGKTDQQIPETPKAPTGKEGEEQKEKENKIQENAKEEAENQSKEQKNAADKSAGTNKERKDAGAEAEKKEEQKEAAETQEKVAEKQESPKACETGDPSLAPTKSDSNEVENIDDFENVQANMEVEKQMKLEKKRQLGFKKAAIGAGVATVMLFTLLLGLATWKLVNGC